MIRRPAWLALPALLLTVAAQADGPRLTLPQLRARYADPAGHIANVGGVEIYYKDEGRGPAILMVHGSVSTLRTYDGVAARLAAHYRVIRYDVPPGGLSGPVSDAAASSLRPEDIAAGLLAQLHVTSVTAVGVSSGATLCLFLAASHPALVRRLILSDAPADPVDTSHMVQPKAFTDAQRQAAATHFQSQAFWNLFLDYFSGDPSRLSPDIRRQYYDFNRRIPEPNPLALVAQVRDHARAVQAMSLVTAPVLLVWGARDPLLPPASIDVLQRYLVHAQVSRLILPDVGHYPPLEVPVRFARITATYIEAATPAAAH